MQRWKYYLNLSFDNHFYILNISYSRVHRFKLMLPNKQKLIGGKVYYITFYKKLAMLKYVCVIYNYSDEYDNEWDRQQYQTKCIQDTTLTALSSSFLDTGLFWEIRFWSTYNRTCFNKHVKSLEFTVRWYTRSECSYIFNLILEYGTSHFQLLFSIYFIY